MTGNLAKRIERTKFGVGINCFICVLQGFRERRQLLIRSSSIIVASSVSWVSRNGLGISFDRASKVTRLEELVAFFTSSMRQFRVGISFNLAVLSLFFGLSGRLWLKRRM